MESIHHKHAASPIHWKDQSRGALWDSFSMLSPRRQLRNPVMFVVYIGSWLLLALFFHDLDDLQKLGGVAVHVDHVGGFARRLGTTGHTESDIRLSKGRRVIGTVPGHRVYAGERFWATRLMGPVERGLYRVTGVSASEEMGWKRSGLIRNTKR